MSYSDFTPDNPGTQQELAEPPAPHRSESESDLVRAVNATRLLLEWLIEDASQSSGDEAEERAE